MQTPDQSKSKGKGRLTTVILFTIFYIASILGNHNLAVYQFTLMNPEGEQKVVVWETGVFNFGEDFFHRQTVRDYPAYDVRPYNRMTDAGYEIIVHRDLRDISKVPAMFLPVI